MFEIVEDGEVLVVEIGVGAAVGKGGGGVFVEGGFELGYEGRIAPAGARTFAGRSPPLTPAA